jgi:methylmalonyl-CoA epimerase
MTATPDASLIDHIGIAVTNIDAALGFYQHVLGLVPGGDEVADGARIIHLDLGQPAVELLEPISPDSPIARFIERRGPGIHHICYRVPDLDAALERCRTQGFELVDQQPRTGAGGRRIAFLHPRSTSGVLIELTE